MAGKLFKNIAWMTIGQITSKILRTVFVLLSARILGVGEFGVLGFALAQAGLFTVLADVGVRELVIRDCARSTHEERVHLVSNGLGLKFLLLAGCTLLLVLMLQLFPGSLQLSFSTQILIVAIFVFDSVKDFFESIMISLERTRTEALINIATTTVLVSVGIPFVLMYPTNVTILVLYAAISILSVIFEIMAVAKSLLFSHKPVKLTHMWSMLKISYVFGLQDILNMVLFGLDAVMLAWYRGSYDVGLYAAAQKIPLFLLLLPGFVSLGMYPEVSRSSRDDPQRFAKIISAALSLLLLLALPIFIGGELLAPQLIEWVFGAEYAQSVPAFRILLGLCFFAFPTSTLGIALTSSNLQKKMFRIYLVATFVSALMNLALIPYFGVSAAAASLLVAQIIIFFGLLITLHSKVAISLQVPVIRLGISLTLLVGVVFLLLELGFVPLPVIVILAGVAYGLPLYTWLKKFVL